MPLFDRDTEDFGSDLGTRALSVTAVENDFVARVYEKLANVYDLIFGPTLHPGRLVALERMGLAADMEDKTEKHPVTPGEVLPARELLGDMYLELKQSDKALEAYQADLAKHPNRYNGLHGASQSAALCGQKDLADFYSKQLAKVTAPDRETARVKRES